MLPVSAVDFSSAIVLCAGCGGTFFRAPSVRPRCNCSPGWILGASCVTLGVPGSLLAHPSHFSQPQRAPAQWKDKQTKQPASPEQP